MGSSYRFSPPSELDRPASISEETWEQTIPIDRPELIDRMGHLVMLGMFPGEALEMALQSMFDDEDALAEEGLETSWEFLHQIASIFPLPWRQVDGRYASRIMHMAMQAEMTSRAIAGSLGYVRQEFADFELSEARQAMLDTICLERSEQITFELRAKSVSEMDRSADEMESLPPDEEKDDDRDDESDIPF